MTARRAAFRKACQLVRTAFVVASPHITGDLDPYLINNFRFLIRTLNRLAIEGSLPTRTQPSLDPPRRPTGL